MATVYLVTDGEYSSYNVLGICDTKKQAEYAKRLFNSNNDIEEFELNGLPDHPPGMCMFRVKMDESGNNRYGYEFQTCQICPTNGAEGWRPYRQEIVFTVWAKDAKHAVKIANEKRIQLLASGKWTTNHGEWEARQGEESEEESNFFNG